MQFKYFDCIKLERNQNFCAPVKHDHQDSHQTPQPEPARFLGLPLGYDQEKTEKERDFGSKKWAIPDFSAVHGQETFSGMAPTLGHSAMRERRKEQFAGDEW